MTGSSPGEPTATPVHLGDYTLLNELGRGGMGVVYRAEDFKLRREVALKVMLPQFAANTHAKARFVREARAQAKVEHDHVAAIHRVDEYEGLPYIVMPLLKGMTLQAALRANPRPPLPEVIRIGREVAEGLSAAHEKGLVHRDIKPANVWLEGKKLRVKVLDFGLARVTDDDGIGGSKGGLTSEGIVVGTPAYMSPEQGRGLPVDGRTDLFSLGIMLYEMSTGELPFRGPNTLALLTALAIDNPQPPAKVNPNVPQSLSDFIMRLLEKDPSNRPPTAERVAEDLRTIELGLVNAVRLMPHEAIQFPVLVPVAPDPFSALDVTEASTPKHNEATPEPATPAAERTLPPQSRGVPLSAVGVLLLVVAGGVGVVFSQMGQKPTDVAQATPPKKPDTPPKKDSPLVPTPEPPRESEFRSLFNGKDLTGWNISQPKAKAEVVTEAGRSGIRMTPMVELWNEERFRDFHLKVDFLTPTGNVSAGIGYRSDQAQPFAFLLSPAGLLTALGECSVRDGILKDGRIVLAPKSVESVHSLRPSGGELKPTGEWNTLEAIAIGDTALHVLNGKVVCVGAELRVHGQPSREGIIRIYCQGKDPVVIGNIRIREIRAMPKEFADLNSVPKQP